MLPAGNSMSHWWPIKSYVGGLEHRKWAHVRALIQRVNRASVSVDREIVGAIGTGLCVFVGVMLFVLICFGLLWAAVGCSGLLWAALGLSLIHI